MPDTDLPHVEEIHLTWTSPHNSPSNSPSKSPPKRNKQKKKRPGSPVSIQPSEEEQHILQGGEPLKPIVDHNPCSMRQIESFLSDNNETEAIIRLQQFLALHKNNYTDRLESWLNTVILKGELAYEDAQQFRARLQLIEAEVVANKDRQQATQSAKATPKKLKQLNEFMQKTNIKDYIEETADQSCEPSQMAYTQQLVYWHQRLVTVTQKAETESDRFTSLALFLIKHAPTLDIFSTRTDRIKVSPLYFRLLLQQEIEASAQNQSQQTKAIALLRRPSANHVNWLDTWLKKLITEHRSVKQEAELLGDWHKKLQEDDQLQDLIIQWQGAATHKKTMDDQSLRDIQLSRATEEGPPVVLNQGVSRIITQLLLTHSTPPAPNEGNNAALLQSCLVKIKEEEQSARQRATQKKSMALFVIQYSHFDPNLFDPNLCFPFLISAQYFPTVIALLAKKQALEKWAIGRAQSACKTYLRNNRQHEQLAWGTLTNAESSAQDGKRADRRLLKAFIVRYTQLILNQMTHVFPIFSMGWAENYPKSFFEILEYAKQRQEAEKKSFLSLPTCSCFPIPQKDATFRTNTVLNDMGFWWDRKDKKYRSGPPSPQKRLPPHILVRETKAKTPSTPKQPGF